MKYIIIYLNAILIFILKYIYKNVKIFKYIKKKDIKLGNYIARLGNCISCHTNKGGINFTGGVPIKTKFGKIYTPNITIISKMNFKNFRNLVNLGINEKFKLLYPVFPYINYFKIKFKDLKNLFLYFKNIKYVNIPNKKFKINFPYKYRKLLILWRFIFFKKYKYKKKFIYNNLKRSNYIIKTLGHCNMCHTKLNNLGFNISFMNYLGNSKNIWNPTSFNDIKKKNINEIINILKNGISKKKIIIGPMIDIVNNSLNFLNKIDIKNISIFIKKINNKNKKEKYKIKKNLKLIYEKGKLLYKENCFNCHGVLSKNFIPNLNKNIFKKTIKSIYNIIKKPIIINNNYYLNSNIMPLIKLNKINIKNLIYYIFINKNLIN